MKSKVLKIDGEFWFTAQYAASLLQTSKKKVEAMVVREVIRARPEGNSFLIAEAEVTRLRRDPKALAEAKEASQMPAYPKRGERMPSFGKGGRASADFGPLQTHRRGLESLG